MTRLNKRIELLDARPDEIDVIRTDDDGRLLISDVRRAQIIRVVRRIIVREGLTAVTISSIAKEMGTSRGVVNHHFANKEEILREALQQAIKDANHAASATLENASGLERLMSDVAGLGPSESDWWPIYVAYLANANFSGNEFYREQVAEADRAHRAYLANVLGSEERAAIVLAIMKGLAMQRLAEPALDLTGIIKSAASLVQQFVSDNATK